MKIHQEVGSLIDWYNIQYYNQGASTYASYDALFVKADGWATGTAVQELISRGIPKEKLLVLKPVADGDATNTGGVAVGQLATIFTQAVATGWNTGTGGWQYKSDPSGAWISQLAGAF